MPDREMTNDEFWMEFRRALLVLLDAVEKWLKTTPRTSEIRKWAKARYPGPIAISAEDVKARIRELEIEE